MKNLLLFPLFFLSFQLIAQETDIQKIGNKLIVTGKIIDINGLPLIGAKIIAKEIHKETTTNFDGKFSLEVDDETIIHIVFIDFEPIDVVVKPQTNIIFLLKEDHNPLDLNSKEVSTSLTRKEMRRIRRSNKSKDRILHGSDLIEDVFCVLEAVLK